jgi:hypothetical protein
MNEIRVRSYDELQKELFADSWNNEIGRFRSRFAFRGLSDARYTLKTTLMRLGGKYAELERHLMRNFKKYAHLSVESDAFWNWMSVAQHYGLPTRLLDWTYSPLVAMHFATANICKFDLDGAIWAVNYVKTHQLLPQPLRNKLSEEGANVFTVEMLNGVIPKLHDLQALSRDNAALFLEPPSMEDRIVNQFAFFSVMSDPQRPLCDFLREHPDIWRKIIIPAELKWEIRDKLDQSNITERVLFPGLDGLSLWLKRHYSPRCIEECELIQGAGAQIPRHGT